VPRGDVYRLLNDLDDATVERIAMRLETLGTDPTHAAFLDAYLSNLPLASAQRVLALGCGTGIEVRALKRRPDFRGQVIGIDHSSKMIELARRLTVAEGLDSGVRYQTGDAQVVDYPDDTFDVVLAHKVLSHVADPLAALKETRRVIKPGGMLAVFDGDYASLTFAHPDAELAKRAEGVLQEILCTNPRVMRDLPRFLQQAGLELTLVQAHVYANIGFLAQVPEAYATALAGSDRLLTEEVERWQSGQVQAAAGGTFFGASNYYTFLACRSSPSQPVGVTPRL
jgi:ubiquinone/menaquinone biosynthesis C-methylase UbiE